MYIVYQKVVEAANEVREDHNVEHNLEKLKLLHVANVFGVDDGFTKVRQESVSCESAVTPHCEPG